MSAVRWRIFDATIEGYGTAQFVAADHNKARAAAFHSFTLAFDGITYREFQRMSRIRLAENQDVDGYDHLRQHYPAADIPKPGARICAEGYCGPVLPALHPTNYVAFVDEKTGRYVNVHPLSVKPIEAKS